MTLEERINQLAQDGCTDDINTVRTCISCLEIAERDALDGACQLMDVRKVMAKYGLNTSEVEEKIEEYFQLARNAKKYGSDFAQRILHLRIAEMREDRFETENNAKSGKASARLA